LRNTLVLLINDLLNPLFIILLLNLSILLQLEHFLIYHKSNNYLLQVLNIHLSDLILQLSLGINIFLAIFKLLTFVNIFQHLEHQELQIIVIFVAFEYTVQFVNSDHILQSTLFSIVLIEYSDV